MIEAAKRTIEALEEGLPDARGMEAVDFGKRLKMNKAHLEDLLDNSIPAEIVIKNSIMYKDSVERLAAAVSDRLTLDVMSVDPTSGIRMLGIAVRMLSSAGFTPEAIKEALNKYFPYEQKQGPK